MIPSQNSTDASEWLAGLHPSPCFQMDPPQSAGMTEQLQTQLTSLACCAEAMNKLLQVGLQVTAFNSQKGNRDWGEGDFRMLSQRLTWDFGARDGASMACHICRPQRRPRVEREDNLASASRTAPRVQKDPHRKSEERHTKHRNQAFPLQETSQPNICCRFPNLGNGPGNLHIPMDSTNMP